MSSPPNALPSAVPEGVLRQLREIVGRSGYLEDPAEIAPYCTSWRDDWVGSTPIVLRPASVDEVSRLVKVCASAGVPIVPQGGNTGLTGAGQPHSDGSEVIISTSRLRAIRNIDTLNDTITVEAGVVLSEIQRRAAFSDRLFPLSLGAEGTCQIGGNISTNAGGVQVFRYGSTRNLVLGLEVVLADGRVWNGLRALRKDNTGYDLKQLFIGAEGTLGVITAAVLRLFPKPVETQTAFVAVASPHAAVELLAHMRGRMGEHLSTFELMRRICIDAAIELLPGQGDPLDAKHPWYVLVETTGLGPIGSLRQQLEETLASALEKGIADDAVIAESGEQRKKLWSIREYQGEVQRRIGTGIKHDVSIPVSRIAEFIKRADVALGAAYPGIRHYAFGHVGDGNIHYNPIAPADWCGDFAKERERINRIVHDTIASLGGSISAEHGIGQLRIKETMFYKPAIELEMMRSIKRAFDPKHLMNPGKIFNL